MKRKTQPKPLAYYNMFTVYCRGDKKFANVLKSKAALTGRPFADCVREWLEFAVDNVELTFAAPNGNDEYQSGNA